MAAPSVLTVVLTGILLVFFILVALTVIITIYGGIMSLLHKKDTKPAVKSEVAPPAPAVEPVKAAPVASSTVADDNAVIAVIAAAVAAMGGGEIVSVKKAASRGGRHSGAVNGWKQSALSSYVQQF